MSRRSATERSWGHAGGEVRRTRLIDGSPPNTRTRCRPFPRCASTTTMAAPQARGEPDRNRKTASQASKKSAPSLRRRRSRSWHEFAPAERVPANLALKVRPCDDEDGGRETMSPLASPTAVERPLSLGSSRDGPAHAETVSAGPPSPRVSRKWYQFFGKRRKGVAGSPSDPAAAAATSSDRSGSGRSRKQRSKESAVARAPAAEQARVSESSGSSHRENASAGVVAAGEAGSSSGVGGSSGSSSEDSSAERAGSSDLPPQAHVTAEQSQHLRGGTASTRGSASPAVTTGRGDRAGQEEEEPGRAAEKVGGAMDEAPRTPPSAARPTLPSYEEARRRTQEKRRQHKQQEHHRGGETGTFTGPHGPSDSAAVASKGGQVPEEGGRKGSSGGGLRKGGEATTKTGEAAAAATMTPGVGPGMSVLCLGIFVSAIGGGEIRRWRPAEVGAENYPPAV